MTQKALEVLLKKLIEKLGLRITKQECGRCHGLGTWQDGGDCAVCDGAGEIYDLRERE